MRITGRYIGKHTSQKMIKGVTKYINDQKTITHIGQKQTTTTKQTKNYMIYFQTIVHRIKEGQSLTPPEKVEELQQKTSCVENFHLIQVSSQKESTKYEKHRMDCLASDRVPTFMKKDTNEELQNVKTGNIYPDTR